MKKENQKGSSMLNAIAKALGMGSEAKAEEVVEQVVGSVEQTSTQTIELKVDTSEIQAELDAIKTQFEAATNELTAKLEEATAALADATGKLEAAEAAKTAAEAKVAELVAAEAARKLAARKEAIVAAIGTDKADALMAATEGLDDAQFTAVVSAMAGKVDAEAQSPLFKEVGVTAEADAAKVVEESAEMKLLKQKYGTHN